MEILARENLAGARLLPLQFPELSLPKQGESGLISTDFSF